MKCPLLCIGYMAGQPTAEIGETNCLKEECAWWDKLSESCCLHRIMVSLEALAGEASKIANKMPHEEQFRR